MVLRADACCFAEISSVLPGDGGGSDVVREVADTRPIW